MQREGEGELRYWLIRGALVGAIVLGVGGRLLMRVIAHMEHRTVFVFTPEGTLTVVFLGAVAGLFSGLIYYLSRRFLNRAWLRTVAFVVICELVTWRGVHGLLLIPQLMFMALSLVFLGIIDTMGRRVHT